MGKVYKTIFFLILLLTSEVDVKAQIVQKLSGIQPAGIIHLSAENSTQTDSINWIISSYFINEISNEVTESADTIFTEGDSIEVLLTKKVGSYTFYKALAFNNAFTDSAIFQVLNRGVPEKYLYTNSSISEKPIVVFIILPYDIPNANFIMIMHGVNRNSLEYLQAWKNFGIQNNYVCVAPTFSTEDWPSSRSYNLGNLFQTTDGSGSLKPESVWSFSQISQIHDELVELLGMNDSQYDIWGHSAGAQFVHRFMTFKPDYKIRYAISANAGWYTLPDLDIDYPFGLKNDSFSFDETLLEDLADKKMIIMRGEKDIVRDSYLNTSPEADEQGLNRFERALTYYNYGSHIASNHKWRLIDVKDTGHDFELMAKAAQDFLLNPTSVRNEKSELINLIKLHQNYPNPFNLSTVINIEVPQNLINKNTKANLILYNSLGEEIAVLLKDGELKEKTNLIFNGKDDKGNILKSGVYFYRLKVGNNLISNKMVLLK